ncbi:serine/threonine-protein kinase TNNI3K-like isoform X2 [Oscarella lobularis]|uniref:serine/threonine-protein kinase TNNI3K-like isoform X2 n=1 Tax=Oscarella lobularis TaxID=121494 RepID=UPI003313B569
MGNNVDAFLFRAVERGDRVAVSSYVRRYPEKWRTVANAEGKTCLHLARDVDMAIYLISAGADMEARDNMEMTPFLSAVEIGNGVVMDVLVKNRCDIHAKGELGDALAIATLNGHLGIIRRLVELGLDVNSKSAMRFDTSLHLACWENRVEIAEYLLSVGADIEAVNRLGRTPFLEAISCGKEKVIHFLIAKGCNIYAKDEKSRGAVEIASSRNYVELKIQLEKIFRQREAASLTDKGVKVKETQSEVSPLENEEDIPAPAQDNLAKSYLSSVETAAVVEEENLTKDLHASQQVVRGLQRRLVTAEAARDSALASQQLVCDLQRLLDVARSETIELRKERTKILSEHEDKMSQVQEASRYLRERSVRAEADLKRMSERSAQLEQEFKRTSERCAQLKRELDATKLVSEEAQRNLSKYEDVLKISSADVQMSDVKLGGGSYGDVRVGRWRGCNVAVKTFFDFLRVDLYLRRLEQEISICRHVHHPNVVSLLGVITQDGIPLSIVSELLEASLYDVIVAAGGRLFLREQIDIAVGCSSGIYYLHGLDILHGDIRSTNVVLTSLMEAKICDLGAARFALSSLSAGPMSPDYVAPERLEGGQHNTKMADVYSLGVTLIELMTGEHPATSKRMVQGASIRHPVMQQLGLGMVNRSATKRPLVGECLSQIEAIQQFDEEYKGCTEMRMVKGKTHGKGKVHLVSVQWS